jgi:hypothetical protein
VNEALIAMKDEILEAVSLAIAALRREHTAALKTLMDELTQAHVLLREEHTALLGKTADLKQQLEHARTYSSTLDECLAEVKADVQTIPQLILDAKAEVQTSVDALGVVVGSKANDEDVQAVWDSLVDYARLDVLGDAVAPLAVKADVEAGLAEVRSTTGSVIEEVLSLSNQLNTMAVDVHAAIEKHVEALKEEDDTLRHLVGDCVKGLEDRDTRNAEMLSKDLARITTECATKEDFAQLQLGLQDELLKQQEALSETVGPMATLNDLERIRADVVELVGTLPTAKDLEAAVAPLAFRDYAEAIHADLTMQIEARATPQAVAAAVAPLARQVDLDQARSDLTLLVETRATPEAITAAVAPLARQVDLDQAREHLEVEVHARVTPETLNKTLQSFVRKEDFEETVLSTRGLIESRATPEAITTAVAPLARQVDLDQAKTDLALLVETRATPEAITAAVAPLALQADLDQATSDLTLLVESRATPEAVAAAVAPLARQADLDQAKTDLTLLVETRATPEAITAAVAPLVPFMLLDQVRAEICEDLAERPKAVDIGLLLEPFVQRAELQEVRALAESKAAPQDYDVLVSRVRSELIERYAATEDWLRGGAGYQAFALCRHNGATWQSLRDTKGEPGVSDDWMLQVDGVKSAGAETVDGALLFVTRMASGAVFHHPINEPVPVFRGVYSPDEQYKAWDSVAKDSHVFLCLRSSPTGAPGEVQGEWQVFSGPRGKTGKPANEKAITDNVLRTLVPQLQAAVDAQPATAIQ